MSDRWCEVPHKPGDGECIGCYLDVADAHRPDQQNGDR